MQCIRPYHVDNTRSRLITEVKQHWAALVLGWVTAWEYAVLYSFCFQSQKLFGNSNKYSLVFDICIRPYHVESTRSRLITEVKQHWAALVLGWVTAWEYAVQYSF